jgi:hypothetical protein
MEEDRIESYLTDSGNWPMWPFLPVEKGKQGGILFAESVVEEGIFRVYLCDVNSLPDKYSDFRDIENVVYDTAEELIQAGWKAVVNSS